jgi:hypothetical protein
LGWKSSNGVGYHWTILCIFEQKCPKFPDFTVSSLECTFRITTVATNRHSHFHTEYQGERADYDIRTLDLLAGRLPSRANALVLEWASQHKKELMANWEKSVVPDSLDKIEPLD